MLNTAYQLGVKLAYEDTALRAGRMIGATGGGVGGALVGGAIGDRLANYITNTYNSNLGDDDETSSPINAAKARLIGAGLGALLGGAAGGFAGYQYPALHAPSQPAEAGTNQPAYSLAPAAPAAQTMQPDYGLNTADYYGNDFLPVTSYY